jgi:tryptophanyl-tRNA synthetase
MEDEMFLHAEEDLHGFYSQQGKVDPVMSYRRKLSLNLMTADFLGLLADGFDAVMIVLGIDEHQYVNFGLKTLQRAQSEHVPWFHGKQYAAMYSGIIRGFHGYPKMSKSFPQSGITVDMSEDEIRRLIEHGEIVTPFPETNVVYQMISSVSLYGNDQIKEVHEECHKQSNRWRSIKNEYAKHLHELCQLWHER